MDKEILAATVHTTHVYLPKEWIGKTIKITSVACILLAVVALMTNQAMAHTANSTAGFIANPTTNNNTVIGTTDPNYNTYQNLALGFSI